MKFGKTYKIPHFDFVGVYLGKGYSFDENDDDFDVFQDFEGNIYVLPQGIDIEISDV
jgi:hypothetical protein